MNHTVERHGELAVVCLAGKITVGNALEDVRAVVEDLIAEECLRVVFDLGEVSFVDSAGLGEIVACHRSLDQIGGRLVLASPRGKVKDLIELTRIGELLPVFPSLGEAMLAVSLDVDPADG